MAEFASSLVPITELDPTLTAERMVTLVDQNHDLLEARHILGPLQRYRTPSEAEYSVRRLQGMHQSGRQEVFGIVDEEQRLQGVGTVMGALTLSRLRLPLPPGLAEMIEERGRHYHIEKLATTLAVIAGLNKVELPFAGPNITAWTSTERPDLLQAAYMSLTERWQRGNRPWTIEPTRSPAHVHEVISVSAMQYIKTDRFDDQETKLAVPPRSKLYARIKSKWLSPHGDMKELRTGAKDSLLDTLEEYERTHGIGGGK